MQTTSVYKLNLIETSDTFSPDPLNENTQKLEAALAAETKARTDFAAAEAKARADADAAEASARANAISAIDNRVKVMEARRTVWGTYKGANATNGQTISLGFTPQVVIIFPINQGTIVCSMTYAGCVQGTSALQIVTNGFRVLGSSFDASVQYYNYLAFD